MQRRTGRNHDRQGHEVGERHADIRVEPDTFDRVLGLLRRFLEGLAVGLGFLVFDFLRRPSKVSRA